MSRAVSSVACSINCNVSLVPIGVGDASASIASIDFVFTALSCAVSVDSDRLYVGVELESMFLALSVGVVELEPFETFVDIIDLPAAVSSLCSSIFFAFFFVFSLFTLTRRPVSSLPSSS
jgi:hypothetical protein